LISDCLIKIIKYYEVEHSEQHQSLLEMSPLAFFLSILQRNLQIDKIVNENYTFDIYFEFLINLVGLKIEKDSKL